VCARCRGTIRGEGKDWRTLLDEATVAEFGRVIAAE
jgi:hypothetical protein